MMNEANLIKLVKSNATYKGRVQSSLNETNQMISKELGYSEDLQKKDRVSELVAHAKKLERVLAA
tara:strand:+ start:677 stop:871 length:195 start_codon:yes stop_codon:yes gene_type:complete